MSLFSNVEPIRFAGTDAKTEFAYRVYDQDRQVLGKRMQELGSVSDDAAPLLAATGHEAWRVDEHHQRNAKCVAHPDKARRLGR